MNKPRREMIDQLQRGERQCRGAIALGLGQAIDDACGVEQLQTLERERRAGTVTQQPLQARAIVRGEGSTYSLNGREVRLKDVQLLFADAATGAHSPALVSQGRVAAIINAKPQERRQLLEEAAGISGLNVRRREAELRLKAADANLVRLDDVMKGAEAQAQGLRRQAKSAQRYRELSDRIRGCEAALLRLQWSAAVEALQAAERELRTADATLGEARLTLSHSQTGALTVECGVYDVQLVNVADPDWDVGFVQTALRGAWARLKDATR